MSNKIKKKEPVCAVCRQIRYFLMVGIPLVILIGTQNDLEPPAIPLHEVVANFIVVALVIVVSLVSSIGSQLYWNGFDAAGVPLIRAIWGMFVGDIAGIFLALGVVLVTRKVFSRANIETSS